MSALPLFVIVLVGLRLFGERIARAAGLAAESPLERFGFSTALSLAALTGAVFLLSLARVVSFPVSLGLVLLMLAAGGACAPGAFRDLGAAARACRPRGTAGWIAGALAGAVILLGAVAALAPPTGMDTLMFHFVAVKRWASIGGLSGEHSVYFHRTGGFYFPYLFAFTLHGDILAKLLNFAAGVASIALVAATAERLRSGAGPWAAAAAALSPVVGSYLGAEYLELPAQLYVSAAVWAGVRARRGAEGPWAAAALVFLGCAVGVKTSNFAAVLLAPAVLAAAWRRQGRRVLPQLAAGAVLAAAMAGFWPAWNVLTTGSPFPSYQLVADAVAPAPVGVGRVKGVLDILAALLTTSPYYWSESLGPLLVVGLAGAALFDLRDDGRALAAQAGLATAGYLAVLCVALPHYLRGEIHSHVRYLSPVLVPLAAPAAGLLLASAVAGPALVRRLGIAALLVAAMALLPLKAGRTVFAVPVAVGAQAASDYLSAKIETFAACEVLNRLPGQVRVLPFILRPYHLDRPWVEGTEFAGVMDAPERFVRALRERSITHVLVEPRVLRPPHEGLFRHAALREVGTGWPHWDGRRIRLYEVVGE